MRFGNSSVSFGLNITSEKLDSLAAILACNLGGSVLPARDLALSLPAVPAYPLYRHIALLMQDREAFSPAVQGILYHTLSDVTLCTL